MSFFVAMYRLAIIVCGYTLCKIRVSILGDRTLLHLQIPVSFRVFLFLVLFIKSCIFSSICGLRIVVMHFLFRSSTLFFVHRMKTRPFSFVFPRRNLLPIVCTHGGWGLVRQWDLPFDPPSKMYANICENKTHAYFVSLLRAILKCCYYSGVTLCQLQFHFLRFSPAQGDLNLCISSRLYTVATCEANQKE